MDLNGIGGSYDGRDLKIGIVVSRFNEHVTKPLLEGALDELKRLGVSDVDIKVVWVPGAYELPIAAQTLIDTQEIEAVIVLGCIIRGETSHYEHIAQSTSDSIQRIAVERRVPFAFGVLTVESLEQATHRSGGKHGNKGREAARTAVEMAQLLRNLRTSSERTKAIEDLIHREFRS